MLGYFFLIWDWPAEPACWGVQGCSWEGLFFAALKKCLVWNFHPLDMTGMLFCNIRFWTHFFKSSFFFGFCQGWAWNYHNNVYISSLVEFWLIFLCPLSLMQNSQVEKEVKYYQGEVAAALAARDKAIVEVSNLHKVVKWLLAFLNMWLYLFEFISNHDKQTWVERILMLLLFSLKLNKRRIHVYIQGMVQTFPKPRFLF